jgi:hypothetical protein
MRYIPKEIKIARRFVMLHHIRPPFDLDSLVKQHASLHYRPIPINGVDGVTVNLKVPGKTPTVIVNTNQPVTRQRFTLAHELGHLIIPWHTGTIVDDVFSASTLQLHYGMLEQEANTFAAEILMPLDWVLELYTKAKDLCDLHQQIAKVAAVSDIASAIRLTQVLPPEIIFILVDKDGMIVNTGRSDNSMTILPAKGTDFEDSYFFTIKSHINKSAFVVYHWFDMNENIELNISDKRSWREVLDQMANDLISPEGRDALKKSINGIVSAAHSSAKMNNPRYSAETMVNAITNRLKRPGLENFVAHKDFEVFVHKRAHDFYHGIKGK